MQANALVGFFERDLRKLIEEIQLFENEESLWRIQGGIKNSAGNLVLHLIGGTNHFIGAILGKTGYIRDREREFTTTGVERKLLVTQLEELIHTIKNTVSNFTQKDLDAKYPIFFDEPGVSVNYVLTQLLLHLNYHLGQVNYLRRVLE